MTEINISSFTSPIITSHSLYLSPDTMNNNIHSIIHRTLPLLSFNSPWIFPLFILCLLGILLTTILFISFIYLSFRRLNDHLILTNLFICFSVCFIYIILISFLIRDNELFCGLREFLSQFAYAFLYSALLCRYIMQWLATRILSKRTKQLTSLLVYLLLIFIQIPIGILWWYFTVPRVCQQPTTNVYPKLKFHFQRRVLTSAIKPCSYQCIVDYRFYATYTYTIVELFLCTIIATWLFLCRHCHRHKKDKDQSIRTNDNNALLAFFNMFALILINIAWLIWSLIYHFTDPFFAFPSLFIGMFTIGTICLFFILFPQIYFYSKLKMNDIKLPKTTLYSNKLASTDDIKGEELLLHEKQTDQHNQTKQQTLSNGSELSYELGNSGTFLPITRTPRGPYKVTTTNETTPIEKLDKLIYGKHLDTAELSNNQEKLTTNEIKMKNDVTNQQQLQPPIAPLQRQLTSSSIASDFINPVIMAGLLDRSNSNIHPSSMYHSSHSQPRRDETIIPILCTSEGHQTLTPVKMRILVKSPSSSVPTVRRIHSGSDLRYLRQPYQYVHPPPPSPSTTSYYSPTTQPQYYFVDPYRTMPSHSGSHLWQSSLPKSHRHPYSYRQFNLDNRSLSQRLWDIDSGDDEDQIEEHMINTHGRITPTGKRLNDDNHLLLVDNNEGEDSYGKQYIHI